MSTGSVQRVTIRHVAARSGVSVGTVSNVLNRPESVSEATRERVQRAIAELGFVRNANAGQLRTGRFRALGLIVLDITNPFFNEVARGAEDAANQAGYLTILCNSEESAEREHRYLDMLHEQRVDGILISPVYDDSARLGSRRQGPAIVLLDRMSSRGDLCAVAVDDVRGGALAAAHLVELGHRRIAYVTGPLAIRQCGDRLRGARQAIERAGLDPDAVLRVVERPTLATHAGRDAGQAMLDADDRPTACFCANDLLALGVLAALHAAGRDVPRDMAVVGYDDIQFAASASVALTSVRQPMYRLGFAAAQLALTEVVQEWEQHVHQQVVFQPELVVRESTGPPPGRRRRARAGGREGGRA